MYYGNLRQTQNLATAGIRAYFQQELRRACMIMLPNGDGGYRTPSVVETVRLQAQCSSAINNMRAATFHAWARFYGRTNKYTGSGKRAARASTLATQITVPADWRMVSLEG